MYTDFIVIFRDKLFHEERMRVGALAQAFIQIDHYELSNETRHGRRILDDANARDRCRSSRRIALGLPMIF